MNEVRFSCKQFSGTIRANLPLSLVELRERNPPLLNDVGFQKMSMIVTLLPAARAAFRANVGSPVVLHESKAILVSDFLVEGFYAVDRLRFLILNFPHCSSV